MDYLVFKGKVESLVDVSQLPKSLQYIDDKEIYISTTYEVGGVRGGSCWESSNPTYYTATDVNSDFIDLEEILLSIVPNLAYLQFKKIDREVKLDEYIMYEYYGNRVDYKVKYISVGDLYDILCEMNVL